MFGKPPITALQEYCAKKAFTVPTYQFIDSNDGSKSFVCLVEAVGMTEYGNGRSKREAKHDAAANLIKKMRITHPDIVEIPQAPHETTPPTDAVVTLRDFCVKNDHPLPTFDIIQQAGPAEAPEYTAECVVATIIRYGVATNKKGAKQKAALEVLNSIMVLNNQETEIVPVDSKLEEAEEKRYMKFKTYRELTESQTGQIPGTLISDRHNFFKNFFDNLKMEAMQVLNDANQYTSKERVLHLFESLKIVPKIKTLPSKTSSMLMIDLNCEYDVVFTGFENKIYEQILEYFRHMLN